MASISTNKFFKFSTPQLFVLTVLLQLFIRWSKCLSIKHQQLPDPMNIGSKLYKIFHALSLLTIIFTKVHKTIHPFCLNSVTKAKLSVISKFCNPNTEIYK